MSDSLPVEVSGVRKRYGRQVVLTGVDLTSGHPETLGIIGPNGAGKTTLLRIVAGLIRADAGSVRLFGMPPRRALGCVPVVYFAGEATLPPSARARTWGALFDETLEAMTERRRLRVLSRGTRQMVGLEAVLSQTDARLIILDEPWEHLDPDGARWLSEALRQRAASGATVILSSHRLYDLAGLCDRYAFLVRGVVTCRSAREVAADGPVTGEALLAAFDELMEARE